MVRRRCICRAVGERGTFQTLPLDIPKVGRTLVPDPRVSGFRSSPAIMIRFLRLAFLSIVLASLPAAALARSPEETLVAYVDAVQKEGLTAAVRFMHPDDLAEFRKDLEPELERRVKSGRTHQKFAMFADPYHPKQLRPFKDDEDFVAIFIKWMSTSGVAGVSTFEHAKVKPLGYVTEGDLRHVVARFTYEAGDHKSERVSVTTMKMDGGQPMLTLLPELQQVADLVREFR